MEASPTTNRYGLRGSAIGSRMLLVQPDAVLCKLCARGSDDAFDVLHARYRQQVFALVFHLLNRRDGVDDAEDLTQEVFSKAFSSIRTKSADGSFKYWLFAIARNTTFDHIRGRKPQDISLDEAGASGQEPANVVSIASQVENRAELAWLVATVSELPERQREALVLRELAGMSHAEIAGELDTTVVATKQLIKRGRASVGASAEKNGYRSRNLGKELAMAAPILPLAAGGLGLTATGASAAVGVGGLAIGTKVAAATLMVVAIGGSGIAVNEVESNRSDKAAESTGAAGAAAGQRDSATAGGGYAASGGPALSDAQLDDRESRKAAARAKARGRERAAELHARNVERKTAQAKARRNAQANNSNESSTSSGRSGETSGGAQKKTPSNSSGQAAPVESGAGDTGTANGRDTANSGNSSSGKGSHTK